MKKFLFLSFFLAFTLASSAQGTYIPLQTESYDFISRLDIKYGRILPLEFTADKGYERAKVARVAETLMLSNIRLSKIEKAQLQYLMDENGEWLDSLHSRNPRPLFKKLYVEPASFASYSSKKKGLFDIRFNPLISAYIGGESGYHGRFLFSRALGMEVRGNIKKVFSFYFSVTGNAERTPGYVDQVFAPNQVLYQGWTTTQSYPNVPGESYFKRYTSKPFHWNDAIDYWDARGYIKAKILKYITLSFGRDKFFIGEGQRSLILSDYSAPYLFLKFDISYWRFNYQNIFAQLNTNYMYGHDQLLPTKYMALHHLSVNATHWLTFGVFEAVVFQRSTFEISYLNPIIFYKAVESSLGNPDKITVGGDFKMNFARRFQFYGQAILNEFNTQHFFSHDGWWGNKWGMQLGAKYIDIAPGLDAQAEFNIVRPFTYSADGNDNFSNFNQPLAHPLGAGFYEIIFNLHYQPLPKWSFTAKYFIAKVTGDSLIGGFMSNYGGNIMLWNGVGDISNATKYITQIYGNHFAQGATGTINYFEFLATYQPWHNIYFDANILYRSFGTLKSDNNPQTSQSTFMFNIGFRMNLVRRTYMF